MFLHSPKRKFDATDGPAKCQATRGGNAAPASGPGAPRISLREKMRRANGNCPGGTQRLYFARPSSATRISIVRASISRRVRYAAARARAALPNSSLKIRIPFRMNQGSSQVDGGGSSTFNARVAYQSSFGERDPCLPRFHSESVEQYRWESSRSGGREVLPLAVERGTSAL